MPEGMPRFYPTTRDGGSAEFRRSSIFVHGARAFHASAKHAKIGKLLAHLGGRGMKAYMCVICGFVYEEAKGVPDQGIAPGTLWKDVPENWTCPDCGAPKSDFEMVEI
jgi:rubredoxin